jgi:hypothetical protein
LTSLVKNSTHLKVSAFDYFYTIRKKSTRSFIFFEKFFSLKRKRVIPFRWELPVHFFIMKTPENQLKCHSSRCNKQALIIYRRRWLCVLHALASVRIRQLIQRVRGGK